jgi:hypothetical protein
LKMCDGRPSVRHRPLLHLRQALREEEKAEAGTGK